MSHIAALSVNHQIASVEIREKVAFTQNELLPAIETLKLMPGIKSCVIFSTCNRSEIYINCEIENSREILTQFLATIHGIEPTTLLQYINYFENDDAIAHLCNVASGLDSLVLGEPQIFGQLKDAYHFSKKHKALDKTLEKLFQHAFATAKKVRSETKIGASPISVAYCAVKLSEKIFTNLANQTVLLVGSGEMIELSAQHLHEKGVKRMIIANRTLEKTHDVAIKFDAEAINLKQLSEYLHLADIVISSTAAPIPIIGKGLIETALVQRKHQPMLLIDLAIPRDIEPESEQLEDIFLYTVDDLEQVIENNIESRKEEKIFAEKIIEEENVEFRSWLNSLPNETIIKNYNKQASELKSEAVTSAMKKLDSGVNADEVVKELADQLTNKLLHAPFQNIKKTPNINLDQCKACVPKVTKKTINLSNS